MGLRSAVSRVWVCGSQKASLRCLLVSQIQNGVTERIEPCDLSPHFPFLTHGVLSEFQKQGILPPLLGSICLLTTWVIFFLAPGGIFKGTVLRSNEQIGLIPVVDACLGKPAISIPPFFFFYYFI